MRKLDRQSRIVDRLVRDGALVVAPTAEALGVSEETVRRDLKELERQGRLERHHGGARVLDESRSDDYDRRLRSNPTGKRALAQAVAMLVAPGSSVMIDTGTTTLAIALALRARTPLIVVTNSVDVARTLAFDPRNEVFMAGGRLSVEDGASLGPTAIEYVGRFSVDWAIVSAAALDAADGARADRVSEADFTRAVLARARRRMLAIDATKFGRAALMELGPLSAFDVLVTDRAPEGDLAAAIEAAGLELVVAG